MNQDISPFQTDSPSVCLSLLQVTMSSCTKLPAKQLKVLQQKKGTLLRNAPDALSWSRGPLQSASLQPKKNTKADTVSCIIANAHKDDDFVFGVELTCLNVPGGGMNERRKFNDTMRVTQWLIEDLEKKVLGDSDVS